MTGLLLHETLVGECALLQWVVMFRDHRMVGHHTLLLRRLKLHENVFNLLVVLLVCCKISFLRRPLLVVPIVQLCLLHQILLNQIAFVKQVFFREATGIVVQCIGRVLKVINLTLIVRVILPLILSEPGRHQITL